MARPIFSFEPEFISFMLAKARCADETALWALESQGAFNLSFGSAIDSGLP
jgi:hypothetical protein